MAYLSVRLSVQVETPTFSWVINSPGMDGGRHYVTIFMLAAVADDGEDPRVMEPDKCEGTYTEFLYF